MIGGFGLVLATVAIGSAVPTEPQSQEVRPINAAWFIGKPTEPLMAPKHFSLGPSTPGHKIITITGSRLLPNVLVLIDQDAIRMDGVLLVSRGAELFQQPGRQPVFCSFQAHAKLGYFCFSDPDGDGRLDSSMRAKALVTTPRIFAPDPTTLAKLATPVSYHAVDRETCTCQIKMELVYVGRRKMFSSRDASFMMYVSAGDDFSTSGNIEFDVNKLPTEYHILGAKFANIHQNGKLMEFDLTSDFALAPYDAVYGPRGPELGF